MKQRKQRRRYRATFNGTYSLYLTSFITNATTPLEGMKDEAEKKIQDKDKDSFQRYPIASLTYSL
jgi:hypothetical protein